MPSDPESYHAHVTIRHYISPVITLQHCELALPLRTTMTAIHGNRHSPILCECQGILITVTHMNLRSPELAMEGSVTGSKTTL